MNGVTAELVRGYASLFVHCWDYFAVQQRDGSYRPSYRPLSLSHLADHLMGKYTLGTFAVDREGYCSSAVLDVDHEDGLEGLVLLVRKLAGQGIFTLLEATRRGWHLWIFFDQPVMASHVRVWLLPYARMLGAELFPKQDMPRSGGVGSLVRLPLGIHRQTGGWYPFVVPGMDGQVVPVGETVPDCIAWCLGHVQRVRVPDVAGRLEQTREGQGRTGEAGARVVVPGEARGREMKGAIREWCRSQDIVEVIGRYTTLDRRGIGRCPLPGHHSRGDVRPSLQVFGGNDPHWYCYTWGRAGNVFDFLCLYHGLTVREAWERLREGVLL